MSGIEIVVVSRTRGDKVIRLLSARRATCGSDKRTEKPAKVFLIDHDSDKADEWEEALPVIDVGHGDYIALEGNTTKDPDDPPVLYLSRDGDNLLLAESFTAFLTVWERLCYIGPEFHLLERLRDYDDGSLDPDSPEADQVRQLFGMRNVEHDR